MTYGSYSGPAPEQYPIPCQRCGASMRPVDQGPRYDDRVDLRCAFCGAAESLSNDDRVRVSQERVAQLRMAQEAAEAPARHAEQIIAMRPWLGGLVVGGVMALNGANSLSSALAAVRAAGPAMNADQRLSVLSSACVYPMLGVGVAGGMFLGWTLAMRRYRAAVEPERWARAPLVPGGPARCRCCGADLPARWGAFVPCTFCGTQNLTDRALLERRESLLVAETSLHQRRAAGVIARANTASQSFTRWSVAGAVVGAASMGLVGVAIAFALSR